MHEPIRPLSHRECCPRMITVDLRIVRLAVPPQEAITRDNVTIKVTAVVYF